MRPWFNETEHSVWKAAGLQGLPEADADVAFPAIDSKFIKTLPIGQIQAQTRQSALQLFQSDSPEDLGDIPMASVLETFRDGGTSRGLGDSHYAEVAQVYGKAVNDRQNPTAAVAEHFVISKSAAAKQVARAREHGFLPKTTRGRVGRLQDEL